MSFCASSERRKRTQRLIRWPWSEHSCHLYQCPSKIHPAGFRMQGIRYIWTTHHVSFRGNKYQLDAFHVHCTVWYIDTDPSIQLCVSSLFGLRFRGQDRTDLSEKGPVLWRLTVKSVFIYVIIVTCNLYKHTSGNVWWQYYPRYITLGNDLICNASVHCLYIIRGATVSLSTEHGDDLFRPRHVTNCNS